MVCTWYRVYQVYTFAMDCWSVCAEHAPSTPTPTPTAG